MQAKLIKSNGVAIDYTPAAAVAAGDVIEQGNLLGYAPYAIAADELGSLNVEGVFDIQKAAEAFAAGDRVYWDNDGNPTGRTAGDGCLTKTATGNNFAGRVVIAAASGDQLARVYCFPSDWTSG